MKNINIYYIYYVTLLLLLGVCLLSLIIFPWSPPKPSCEKDTTSELYNFLVFYTPHASTIAFITNFMVTFSIIGALDKFVISITTSKLPIAEYIKSFSRKVVLFFLALGIKYFYKNYKKYGIIINIINIITINIFYYKSFNSMFYIYYFNKIH